MSASHRLARALVRLAARRWPSSSRMRDEWLAELTAISDDRQRLAFAASLVVSPSVDGTVLVAGGVTLLAAALANAVHATGPLTMVAAAGVMALAALRLRLSAPVASGLIGPALFGFLLIGNAVAVMPFMGLVDVGPAALVWTAGMLLVSRMRGPVPLIAGAWATMTAATIAGSWHAATSLGAGLWWAPAWLPLALLPPGTAPSVPAMLLGNAAAMVAPMLLCAVFVVALALRAPAAPSAALRSPRWRWAAALIAAPSAVVICRLTTMGTNADSTMQRLLDHSAVFGFGFAANVAGQAAVAVVAALLAMRLADSGSPERH